MKICKRPMLWHGYPESEIVPLTPTLSLSGRGKRERAFTYLEIIAGIVIISFILFGMNAVFGVGIRNNKKAERIQRALGLAQDLMEQAIARSFNGSHLIIQKTIDELEGTAVITYPGSGSIPWRKKKSITVTVTGPDMTDVRLYCDTANLRWRLL